MDNFRRCPLFNLQQCAVQSWRLSSLNWYQNDLWTESFLCFEGFLFFIVCMFVCLKSYLLCDRLRQIYRQTYKQQNFPTIILLKYFFRNTSLYHWMSIQGKCIKYSTIQYLEMPVESTSLYETVQCLSQVSNNYKSIRPTTRPTLLATMTIKRNRLSHKKDTIHNFAVCNCYYFLL